MRRLKGFYGADTIKRAPDYLVMLPPKLFIVFFLMSEYNGDPMSSDSPRSPPLPAASSDQKTVDHNHDPFPFLFGMPINLEPDKPPRPSSPSLFSLLHDLSFGHPAASFPAAGAPCSLPP